MGLGKRAVFMLLMAVVLVGVAMGAVYKVGDSAHWTIIGHVDYNKWAASKTFHVGDTILFVYNNSFHNVLRVNHQNYRSCNATAPFATYTSGNDSFVLKGTGHFYFLCGFPGHCLAGQKVDIRVPGASSPSASPSLSPSSASYGPSQPAHSVNSAPLLHSSTGLSAFKLALSVLVCYVAGFAY